jgi:hypothetical protein
MTNNYAALDVDACIRQMWDSCGSDIEDFTVASDQWWGVWVTCGHGTYHGVSASILDLSTAFQWALQRMVEAHSLLPHEPCCNGYEYWCNCGEIWPCSKSKAKK